jgi:ADP-ribose pyrophosphatase YjhB (NUDIX family)
VERGESLGEALAREILEECSLHASIDTRPLAIVESISPDRGSTRHVIHLVFAAEIRGGADQPTGPPCALSEDPAILEAAWFSSDELAAIVLHPPIQDLVCKWLEELTHEPVSWPATVYTGPRWAD